MILYIAVLNWNNFCHETSAVLKSVNFVVIKSYLIKFLRATHVGLALWWPSLLWILEIVGAFYPEDELFWLWDRHVIICKWWNISRLFRLPVFHYFWRVRMLQLKQWLEVAKLWHFLFQCWNCCRYLWFVCHSVIKREWWHKASAAHKLYGDKNMFEKARMILSDWYCKVCICACSYCVGDCLRCVSIPLLWIFKI